MVYLPTTEPYIWANMSYIGHTLLQVFGCPWNSTNIETFNVNISLTYKEMQLLTQIWFSHLYKGFPWIHWTYVPGMSILDRKPVWDKWCSCHLSRLRCGISISRFHCKTLTLHQIALLLPDNWHVVSIHKILGEPSHTGYYSDSVPKSSWSYVQVQLGGRPVYGV